MMTFPGSRFRTAGVCLLWLACAAYGASTTSWEMSTYRDFLAGRFSGTSLTRDGRLMLAPRLDTVFAADQPIIWSMVRASDGTLYAGTGHRGRVFRIDPSGHANLLWTADQPEVFALALDPKGVLYAGTSPNGVVYRIENGKASEYFTPQAKYIWALAFAPDGTLYVGTGDQGKVFRVTGPGKGEVYYDTGQSHVTCLALDQGGRLLAGSEPNGLIYRISAKDKAFVLYDAGLPEIRTIVPAPDGSIYAAALGGSMTRRNLGGAPSTTGIPASASVTVTSTSVSVTEDGTSTQGGPDLKPKPDASKPAPSVAAPPTTVTTVSPVLDVSGVEKSAVYRIDPDNTVETLWSSKDENAYDLALSGRQVMFSTDGQGRIYRLGPDRKLTLLAQTNEGEATRLVVAPGAVLAATGDLGKIFRLGDGPGASGAYESPVHDSGSVAKWGRLSWHGDGIERGRVTFRTRSGNSLRPDRTWSDWSEPLTDPDGSPVRSPNARYIQWQAEFHGGKGTASELDSVALAYLPQNTPPLLKSINVITQMAAAATAAKQPASSAAAATYSITVTDTGDTAPASSSGTPTQTLSRAGTEQMQITWQAEDPDGDRLVYSIYFRGEGEREWKLLKANLTENAYTLDSDVLADGKYNFRVIASDSPANPPGTARDAELVSAPVIIDHTPPVVTAGSPRRAGTRVEIEFDANDEASALRRCEYSLDAGPWVPMESADGIIDSPHEKFVVRLDNLPAGEHLVVVRAVDAAGNTGLAKVVVR